MESRYELRDKVGIGSEGVVYKAQNKETGELVAIKQVTAFTIAEVEKNVENILFTRMLGEGNDHIVRIIEHVVERIQLVDSVEDSVEYRIYSVMEFCDVSMEYMIREFSDIVPLENKQHWVRQLAEVLDYLNQKSVIHRDLKPSNLLLRAKKRPANVEVKDPMAQYTLKIADFGFTKQTSERLQSYVGTPKYMSPEIQNAMKYDVSTDIWSFGVIIIRLLLFPKEENMPDIPYEVKKSNEYIITICKQQNCDPILSELAYQCLSYEPADRPSQQEILSYLNKKVKFKARRKTISIDNSLHLASLCSDLNSANSIDNNKARDFWTQNSFTRKVSWTTFIDSYMDFVMKPQFSKEFLRGAKVLICEENTDVVSTSSFDCAIKYAGFPLDEKRIVGIEKWRTYTDEEYFFHKEEKQHPISMSDMLAAQKQYIDMLLDQNFIFVDPITCELLSLEDNCVRLQLVETNEVADVLPENMDKQLVGHLRIIDDGVKHLTDIEQRVLTKSLLIGKAASGKSTLLKMVMMQLALKAKDEFGLDEKTQSESLIPLMVPVGSIDMNDHSLSFAVRCVRASGDIFCRGLKYTPQIERFLLRAWVQHRLVLLMDGLDESSSGVSLTIGNMDFSSLASVIISSRPTVNLRTIENNYRMYIVLPLSIDLQHQLALKRSVSDPRFLSELQKHQLIARIPLLLSLMIQEFKINSVVLEQPSFLYERGIETLLNLYFKKYRSDIQDEKQREEKEKVRNVMCIIAEDLHARKSRYFEKGTIQTMGEFVQLVWQNLEIDIDCGHFPLIVKYGHQYVFAHFSFQEFCVASVWSDPNQVSLIRTRKRKSFVNTFSVLLRANFPTRREHDKPEFTVVLRDYLADDFYRETFLLCAGIMEHNAFQEMILYIFANVKRTPTIDNLLFNMLRERPGSERVHNLDIERAVINRQSLQEVLLEGLLSESSLMISMSTERITSFGINLKDAVTHLSNALKDNEKCNKAVAGFKILNQLFKQQLSKDYCLLNKLISLLKDRQWRVAECATRVFCFIAERGDNDMISKLWKVWWSNKSNLGIVLRCCTAISYVAHKNDEKILNALLSLLVASNEKQKLIFQLSSIQRISEAIANMTEPGKVKAIGQMYTIVKHKLVQRELFMSGILRGVAMIAPENDAKVIGKIKKWIEKHQFSTQFLECAMIALFMICTQYNCTILQCTKTVIISHIEHRDSNPNFEERDYGSLLVRTLELIRKNYALLHQSKLVWLPQDKELYMEICELLMKLVQTKEREITKGASKTLADILRHDLHDISIWEKLEQSMDSQTPHIRSPMTYLYGKLMRKCNENLKERGRTQIMARLMKNPFKGDTEYFRTLARAISPIYPRDCKPVLELLLKHLEGVLNSKSKKLIEQNEATWFCMSDVAMSLAYLVNGNSVFAEQVVIVLCDIFRKAAKCKRAYFFRARVPKVLGKIGHKVCIGILLDYLDEKSWFVRKEAALALPRVVQQSGGDRLIHNKLALLLDDPNSEVRASAMQSLCKLADMDQLIDLLQNGVARRAAFEQIIHMLREGKNFSLNAKQIKQLESLAQTKNLEANFVLIHSLYNMEQQDNWKKVFTTP